MRGAITPFPGVIAVGCRQKFDGVDPEFGDVCTSDLCGFQFVKIRRLCILIEHCHNIAKSSHAALGPSLRSPRPGSRQFIDDCEIVLGEIAQGARCRFRQRHTVGIALHEIAAVVFNDRSGLIPVAPDKAPVNRKRCRIGRAGCRQPRTSSGRHARL